MNRKGNCSFLSDPENHRLYLLLFFVVGALVRYFVGFRIPVENSRFFFAVLSSASLLCTAVLSGSMLGVYLIPTEAFLLGAMSLPCAEKALDAFSRSPILGLRAALPVMLSIPAFFLAAVGGMRISGDLIAAFSRSEHGTCGCRMRECAALWCLCLISAGLIYTLTAFCRS